MSCKYWPRAIYFLCLVLAPLKVACGQVTSAYEIKLKPASSGFAAEPPSEAKVANNVVIYSHDHKSSQPFTISRFFAKGEIPHFAQAVVKGSPVPTQCNVKTRWPDGSVQHALVSFWATVGSSSGANVFFTDQTRASEAGFLTKVQMLSSDYDFGAQMVLTANENSLTADARKMLEDGAFRYWLQGPVCTQVIIEDRTVSLKYELSWDGASGVHPIFVATFYPGWKGVKVEMIGENDWTTRLRDLQYSMELRTGNPLSDRPVYAKDTFTHYMLTRWRKVFWSGPEPDVDYIDYNLAYLVYSRAIPNYDLTLKLPSSAADEEWRVFNGGDRGDIGGRAEWTKYFPTGGGRGEIGLLPRWYVRYLYDFSSKMYQVMLGDAAVSGYVPIHFRESKTGLSYLRSSKIDAFGRAISVDARPTVWLANIKSGGTTPQDRITPLSAASKAHGWTPDDAHQGGFTYLPYLITGDWYYLEELYFWSANNLAGYNPSSEVRWGRHQDWALVLSAQTRGRAWVLRTLVETAEMAPDGSPEKDYFTEKLYYNLAAWEGFANVRGGAFYDPNPTSPWSWGRNTFGQGQKNPLETMDVQDGYAPVTQSKEMDQDPNQPCRASRVNSPWMENYVYIVLGHIEELGFPVHRLREIVSINLLQRLLSPDYNPYLVASYRHPTYQASTKTFYTDWKCVLQAFTPQMRTVDRWPLGNDDAANAEHGYPIIARGAASFLRGIVDPVNGYKGEEAWDWFAKHLNATSVLANNPKWAFVPRSLSVSPSRGASDLRTPGSDSGRQR